MNEVGHSVFFLAGVLVVEVVADFWENFVTVSALIAEEFNSGFSLPSSSLSLLLIVALHATIAFQLGLIQGRSTDLTVGEGGLIVGRSLLHTILIA